MLLGLGEMGWRVGGARQGQDPTKSAGGPARGRRSFCVLALGPGPSSACTRVLCMHKMVVHAQEYCACTRILTNKSLLLGVDAASGVFLKVSETLIMRIYEKNAFMCFLKKLIKYATPPSPPHPTTLVLPQAK